MSQLTLWKIEASPPANAVRTLAEILGLKLELIDVDFTKLEHKSPEFLKINPLGTVPVLKDGDFVLTDSHAIMKYLLTKYGSDHIKKLYPSDVKARALVDQSLFLDAAVMFIRVKVVALPTIFEGLKGPTERHIQDIQDAYRVVEAYIGDKNYIAADHLTIADISVGSTMAALDVIHKLDKKQFPRTTSWLDHLFSTVPQFNQHVGHGSKAVRDILHPAWATANAK